MGGKQLQMDSLKEVIEEAPGSVFPQGHRMPREFKPLHNALSWEVCQESSKRDRHE
jgi:hypothetical protein